MTDIISQLQSTYFYFTVGGVEFQLQLLTAATLSLVLLLIALIILVVVMGKSRKAKRKAEEEKKERNHAACLRAETEQIVRACRKEGAVRGQAQRNRKENKRKNVGPDIRRRTGADYLPVL